MLQIDGYEAELIVYLMIILVNENTQKRGGARSAKQINLFEKCTLPNGFFLMVVKVVVWDGNLRVIIDCI
jgi:hypothetical protein